MKRLVFIPYRLCVIFFGYTVACAAALVFSPIMVGLVGRTQQSFLERSYVENFYALLQFQLSFLLLPLMIPVVLIGSLGGLFAILLAEIFAIRSKWFFAVLGGLGAQILEPTLDWRTVVELAGTGMIGGLTYWAIAGRTSGKWRAGPRIDPISPAPSGS